LAFVHADERTKPLVAEIAARLTQAGETVGILSDSEFPVPPGMPIKSLRNQAGDYIDTPEVRAAIEEWPNLTRIFIVANRNGPAAKLERLVELSDKVFCVSGTDNFSPLVDGLERFIQHVPSWQKKSHFVWVLGDDEQVAPRVPRLAALIQRDFKVQQSDGTDTRLSRQGIDRIVHYLRDVSIGIALSGGAAHGMTHLGVLKALEEAGITIDRMAGTSAGVLTGVLYCAGYSPDWGIKTFTHDLEPGSMYKWLPRGDGFYLLEKFRSKSWDKMLRKYTFDWRLEQLPIPINTVTTDLVSARSVARSSGDAVDSILESINLPVLSPPICRDGMLLIDGGILNNLPADVLVNQGCNFVIAVDVTANIEHRVGANLPDTPTDKMKTPNTMTALLRTLTVQNHNMSAVGAHPADVLIAPDVSMFASTAFTKTPEMAEIGYQTTMESLPRIWEVLQQLDGQLFEEPAAAPTA
jgi:NTE family protein